jgi:hypothetical protein
MDIPYPARSNFLDSCEAAIREQQAELNAGGVVHLIWAKAATKDASS